MHDAVEPGELWHEAHEYFAYGSNLDAARMRDRCPGATRRRGAVLRDWRIVFDKATNDWDGSAAANIEPAPGAVVEGALYTLRRVDLARLDAFEGHPRHYTRRLLAVEEPGGTRDVAWVYLATPEYRRDGLRPRRDYLERILAGRDLLTASYLDGLAAVSTFEEPPRGGRSVP